MHTDPAHIPYDEMTDIEFEKAILGNMIDFVSTALGYCTVTYRGSTIARIYLGPVGEPATLTLVDASDMIPEGCDATTNWLDIVSACGALAPGANIGVSNLFGWMKSRKVDPSDLCK